MKSELRDHEANITLSLRFSTDNIELVLDDADKDSFKGWAVELFVRPCAVSSFLYTVYVANGPPICVDTIPVCSIIWLH